MRGPSVLALIKGQRAGEREQFASRGLIKMIEVRLQPRRGLAEPLQRLARRNISRDGQGHALNAELGVAVVSHDAEAGTDGHVQRV
jgi:hypothetical protein